VWPKPVWGGEGFLRGKKVVQKDIVHLLWGLGPWEGGEAWLGASVGEPLSRPQALGGGGQQKGGPVFVLSGFNGLEIPRLGGAGNFPHVWCVVFRGCPCGLVIFTTEARQVGSPPGFGVIGGPGYRRVLL